MSKKRLKGRETSSEDPNTTFNNSPVEVFSNND